MRGNKEVTTVETMLGIPVDTTINRKGKIKIPDKFLKFLEKGNKVRVQMYCLNESLLIVKNDLNNAIADVMVATENHYAKLLEEKLQKFTEDLTNNNKRWKISKASSIVIMKKSQTFGSLRIGTFFVPENNHKKLCYKAGARIAYDCEKGIQYRGKQYYRDKAFETFAKEAVRPVIIRL